MRKRNNATTTYQHCSICSISDDEVSCINHSLMTQIRNVLGTIKDSYDQQPQKLETLDFGRLIKMIYGKKFKNLKATSSCKHSELKRFFVSQLKCNQKELDRACGFLSWKIAKRSFHTDIVISQSKSFLRHFIQPEQRGRENSIEESSRRYEVQSSEKVVKQEHQEQQPSERKIDNQENMQQMNYQFIPGRIQPNYEHFSLYYPITWHPAGYMFPNPEMQQQNLNIPDKK